MTPQTTTDRILSKAKALGASLAGVADFARVKNSPSHIVYPKMPAYGGVGTSEGSAFAAWPAETKSVVVVALAHETASPELDWWDGKQGTPGNRVLIRICKELSAWIEAELGLKTRQIHYYVEKGGVFLKDAAMLAGLGCIGRNNLLVTPDFGPRVRLRALLLEEPLPATGPLAFDPCNGCDEPCRRVCPRKAFERAVLSPEESGTRDLPARNGSYDRFRCNLQMERDIQKAETAAVDDAAAPQVKYCRRCEFACPVGGVPAEADRRAE